MFYKKDGFEIELPTKVDIRLNKVPFTNTPIIIGSMTFIVVGNAPNWPRTLFPDRWKNSDCERK